MYTYSKSSRHCERGCLRCYEERLFALTLACAERGAKPKDVVASADLIMGYFEETVGDCWQDIEDEETNDEA